MTKTRKKQEAVSNAIFGKAFALFPGCLTKMTRDYPTHSFKTTTGIP
jgi:hypothetical protein